MNVSIHAVEDIISYLNSIEANVKDDDTIQLINQIKNNLTVKKKTNKSDIIDELNNLIALTDSLREQIFVLSENQKNILVNVEIYTYAISENLEYLKIRLCELSNIMKVF